MKTRLSTNALAITLGLRTLMRAQTARPQAHAEMPGFLAMRDQSDIFLSDLMGHDVPARRTAAHKAADPAANADGTRGMATMMRADLDAMDSIGQINEIVLPGAGQVRALVIGVGGFLGKGTRQISVGFDELTILANDGRADVRIYVDATKDQVQAQPLYRAPN